MFWTTKLLVIANRTIECEEIVDAILERAEAGPVQVTLVAPASSGPSSVRARRAQTAQRLERTVQRLREAGVPVEGVVGDTDPLVAVQDAWDPRHYDEVIVVTLPTGISRWMAADLPHRVERLTAARVIHIVAVAQPAAPVHARAPHLAPEVAVAVAAADTPRRITTPFARRPRRGGSERHARTGSISR
jgi:hypothetical protein